MGTSPFISFQSTGLIEAALTCPRMGENTIPGLFLEVAFVGLE